MEPHCSVFWITNKSYQWNIQALNGLLAGIDSSETVVVRSYYVTEDNFPPGECNILSTYCWRDAPFNAILTSSANDSLWNFDFIRLKLPSLTNKWLCDDKLGSKGYLCYRFLNSRCNWIFAIVQKHLVNFYLVHRSNTELMLYKQGQHQAYNVIFCKKLNKRIISQFRIHWIRVGCHLIFFLRTRVLSFLKARNWS